MTGAPAPEPTAIGFERTGDGAYLLIVGEIAIALTDDEAAWLGQRIEAARGSAMLRTLKPKERT